MVELALTGKSAGFCGLEEAESPASDNVAKWRKFIFVKHGGTCSGLLITEYRVKSAEKIQINYCENS